MQGRDDRLALGQAVHQLDRRFCFQQAQPDSLPLQEFDRPGGRFLSPKLEKDRGHNDAQQAPEKHFQY